MSGPSTTLAGLGLREFGGYVRHAVSSAKTSRIATKRRPDSKWFRAGDAPQLKKVQLLGAAPEVAAAVAGVALGDCPGTADPVSGGRVATTVGCVAEPKGRSALKVAVLFSVERSHETLNLEVLDLQFVFFVHECVVLFGFVSAHPARAWASAHPKDELPLGHRALPYNLAIVGGAQSSPRLID